MIFPGSPVLGLKEPGTLIGFPVLFAGSFVWKQLTDSVLNRHPDTLCRLRQKLDPLCDWPQLMSEKEDVIAAPAVAKECVAITILQEQPKGR